MDDDSSVADALVVFQPSGKRGRFAVGTPVLDAARQLGVTIESVCGGRGICGKCQVSVAEGQFAKYQITSRSECLTPPGPIEAEYDAKRGLPAGSRLSCTARVLGDIVVDVPEQFVIAGQTIRKHGSTEGLNRNPALRLCYVELPEPDLHTPLGDADRLAAEIEAEFDLKGVSVPYDMLTRVQDALRTGKWKVTCCVDVSSQSNDLVAIFPGYHDQLSGLAVDIGSTTIAAHLTDLMTGEIVASTGRANPQIRFGEDLMSRVSYVMMNPDGRTALTSAVRDAINEMTGQLLAEAGREREFLLDAVFVANPVMHHLFLGLDPTPLGQAPFNPATSSSVHCRASEIGIALGEGARVYLLPIIAGHVGADAAAVVLAQQPRRSPDPVLIVDVGTNAEIVLWDGHRLFAASSPTGPALEGAEISSGQRAAPGAIERIRIDPLTLEPRFRVIGSELWSDAPGFRKSVKRTGVTGICGSGIIEVIGEMLRAGILSADGIIRGPNSVTEETRLVPHGRTWSYVVADAGPRLLITQNDVRAIQLAKAALYAGVRLLMDKAGIDEVGEIRLAGAFGSYIDPAYALLLGLVPDCAVDRVFAVGNAAGQGALIALLDHDTRTEIENTVHDIQKIETALEPSFQQHFVDAMGMPNSVAPFHQTRAHFALPPLEPRSDENGGRRRRGARRRG